MRARQTVGLLLVAASLAVPRAAAAFCGFYVSGAGTALFNDATQVVMMRGGTRTVLSMQNSYKGPPKDFAMVVPVPVVLKKKNVKTLPREIFTRVDRLAAPRLVEYWERDPCEPEVDYAELPAPTGAVRRRPRKKEGASLGVKVEAKFTVGEYQVVVLSAKDSAGLDTWLRQEKYKIPEGAEPYLRPYVEAGSKFFVAKVDVEKVKFEDGRAVLSPLRFYYDSEKFKLPVRLGMMNSAGTQDLIVHILARGKRYQVANYKNAFIPTNLDVAEDVRARFGEFYAALFDKTVEKNPGAVITEYAWDASGCDPCPTPALTPSELATLGADVLTGSQASPASGRVRAPRRPPIYAGGFVLTRLHARYKKDEIGEDLVFEEAPAVAGGREWRTGADGGLEKGAKPSPTNTFQARYAIRHPWKGKIECEHPVRGRWGGPPGGTPARPTMAATNLATAPRGKLKLASMVRQDVPEVGLKQTAGAADKDEGAEKQQEKEKAEKSDEGKEHKTKKEKGCSIGAAPGPAAAFFVALWLLGWRRRRRWWGRGV